MHFEGDLSAVQLAQSLMKLAEGEIPGKLSSDLMKLADKLCHIITREWTETLCFLKQAVVSYEEIVLLPAGNVKVTDDNEAAQCQRTGVAARKKKTLSLLRQIL